MESKKNLMTRVAQYIVDRRKLILIVFIVLALISVYTSTLVVTNDSLEHFLPADTETRLGLDIMDREFVTYDTAQVVVRNISLDQARAIADELAG
ncbi:MAG: RND transporter, partial [Oscillospiraceae bacterium]|nr:RND transporter [Oscillospiraceae bacterium]